MYIQAIKEKHDMNFNEPGWDTCTRMQGRKERENLGNYSKISKNTKRKTYLLFLVTLQQ